MRVAAGGRKRASAARARGRGVGCVFIFGAGKVGTALARSLRRAGALVTVCPQRKGLPAHGIRADIVIVAVRDRDIGPTATRLREIGISGHTSRGVVVVHCAGALGPDALAAVRSAHVAVAQMHPMISFASKRRQPDLLRGQLHVDGDPKAVRMARNLGRLLDMSPRTIQHLDRIAYHAAAGLVANGAAALAAAGIDVLEKAGVPPRTAAQMLGPLLRSVAENVENLGLPEALTGPIRRGDLTGIERHIETLRRVSPALVSLYVATGLAQIPLARSLGEASGEAFDAIEHALRSLAK